MALGDMNSEHPSGPWPDNVGPERVLARLGVEEHSGRRRPAHLRQRLARGAARGRAGHLGRDHAEGPRQRGRPEAADAARRSDGYTSWPAYASFEDQRKGTLAAGMLADIVVLAADVFTNPPLNGRRRRRGHDDLRRPGRVRAAARGTLTEANCRARAICSAWIARQ